MTDRSEQLIREIDRPETPVGVWPLSRRALLRRASQLGLSAPVVAVLLAACGGDDEEAAPTATGSSSAAPTVISTAGSSAGPSSTAPATTSTVPTAASASPAALKPPSTNQTLIFPYPNEFRTLDPAGATESGSIDVTHSCYEALVATVPRKFEVAPRLAKSWDITEQGQVITFTLQQGVKFHDGTMLDADAVKTSFERVLQMNLGNAAPISDIDTIDVVDQFTVRFTLKAPNVFFVENCTQIGIISPTAWQQNDRGGDFGAAWLEEGHTAGTGPWMLTEFRKNESKTAEKFSDYWRGWSPNRITKIVWPIVPEASTRRQMLEKGEAHIVTSLPLEDVRVLEANPSVQILFTRAFYSWVMPLNVTKPPLDNLKVRQALQYAFDYQTYLDQIWLGNGTIANGPCPPGLPGYVEDAPLMTYDLEKARQLLAEAGVSNVEVEQAYIDTSEEEKQAAVVWQDALKKLGINLKLTAMPWATMFKLAQQPDTCPHSTNRQIGPTRPDPAYFLHWYYGSRSLAPISNWSFSDNQQAHRLVDEARRTIDKDQRTQLLEQANRLLIADAPMVWYIQPDRVDVLSARIQNYAPITVGYPNERDYWEMYLSD